MAYRPRFSGHTRWDDALSIPDAAEADVDLLPWSDDPDYQARRRDAELAHARAQLRRIDQALTGVGDLPASEAPHLARLSREHTMWERIATRLEQLGEHWATGEGDRRLF